MMPEGVQSSISSYDASKDGMDAHGPISTVSAQPWRKAARTGWMLMAPSSRFQRSWLNLHSVSAAMAQGSKDGMDAHGPISKVSALMAQSPQCQRSHGGRHQGQGGSRRTQTGRSRPPAPRRLLLWLPAHHAPQRCSWPPSTPCTPGACSHTCSATEGSTNGER